MSQPPQPSSGNDPQQTPWPGPAAGWPAPPAHGPLPQAPQSGYQAPMAYPPQPGYPAQPAYPGQHAYPAPAGHPGAYQASGPVCRFCGSVPAAQVTFHGHQGMILVMRFLSLRGPFCRDCGVATFRRMTERTLVQGWWGFLSSVITPVVVLMNLVLRHKVASLAAPVRVPGAPAVQNAPMNPGAPLLARPLALVGLAIPVILLVVLIAVSASSG